MRMGRCSWLEDRHRILFNRDRCMKYRIAVLRNWRLNFHFPSGKTFWSYFLTKYSDHTFTLSTRPDHSLYETRQNFDLRDHSCSVLDDFTFIMCAPAVSQSSDDNQFCWRHSLGTDSFEKSVKMNYPHTDASLVYYQRLDNISYLVHIICLIDHVIWAIGYGSYESLHMRHTICHQHIF